MRDNDFSALISVIFAVWMVCVLADGHTTDDTTTGK